MSEQVALQPKQYGPILRFFSNHPLLGALGALGSIASIVSLPFTVFPFLVVPKRELAFSVSPTRSLLVQTAGMGDLAATYKGIRVTGTVTVAQIAIWNAGREPIRPEDVLSTNVCLMVPTNCQILDASILRETRDVVGFSHRYQPLGQRVNIGWKILEHKDGALLQIIYTGPYEAPITMEGIILGQSSPSNLQKPRDIVQPWLLALVLSSILTSAVQVRELGQQITKHNRKAGWLFAFLSRFFTFVLVGLAAYAAWGYWKSRAATTPFGF